MTYFGYQPPIFVGDHYTKAETDALLLSMQNRDNRIINGGMEIWQRGTSTSVVGYGADRWLNNSSGGSFTMSRQAFALGTKLGLNNPSFFLRQGVSGQSAAADYASVCQRIEDVRTYAGETITVLGWAKRNSGAGNMAVEGYQSFGSGGSPSAPVTGIGVTTVPLTNAWTAFAVPMAIPSVTGKTLGSNANDWFQIAFWTSAGSGWNARTNSLGIQTIEADLWGIHIRRGVHTVETTNLYVEPPLDEELLKCQRYFYRASVRVPAGSSYGITCPRKVTMRATPVYSGGGAGFTATDNNAETAILSQTSNALQVLSLDAEL